MHNKRLIAGKYTNNIQKNLADDEIFCINLYLLAHYPHLEYPHDMHVRHPFW